MGLFRPRIDRSHVAIIGGTTERISPGARWGGSPMKSNKTYSKIHKAIPEDEKKSTDVSR